MSDPVLDDDFVYTRTKIVRVVDGDTVEIEVDVGFHAKITEKFRLARINAPDFKDGRDKREASRLFLESTLAEFPKWKIQTLKDTKEKYGRYLVEIFRKSDGVCINDLMVTSGHASYEKY